MEEPLTALTKDSETAVSVLELVDRGVQDVETEFSTVGEFYSEMHD